MQEKVSITPIPGEGQGAAFWRPCWAPRGSAQSIPEWARWWRRREEAGKKGQSVRLALGKGREWGSPAKDVLSRRFQLESGPFSTGQTPARGFSCPHALAAAAAVHRPLTAASAQAAPQPAPAGSGTRPWPPGGRLLRARFSVTRSDLCGPSGEATDLQLRTERTVAWLATRHLTPAPEGAMFP